MKILSPSKLYRFKNSIIVFLLIIISDESFLFNGLGNTVLIQIKYLFYFLFFLFILLYKKSVSGRLKLKIPFILSLSVLLSSIFNLDLVAGGTYLLPIIIISSAIYVQKIRFYTFVISFIRVIKCIIIYSTILYFCNIFKLVTPQYIENAVGTNIEYIGGCIFYGNDIVTRLSGFFREPGVFMIFINLAFLFDVYIIKNRLTLKSLVIYGLPILLTFSTAGIIIYLILTISFVLKGNKLDFKLLFPVLALVLFLFIILNEATFYNKIFGKLDSGYEGSSFIARYSSIVIPLNIYYRNPFFGCGISNFYSDYISFGISEFGFVIDPKGNSTNTFCNLLAIFGSSFLFFLLYGVVQFGRLITKDRSLSLILMVCFIFMFSNESLAYSLIFYILLFYAINYKISKSVIC